MSCLAPQKIDAKYHGNLKQEKSNFFRSNVDRNKELLLFLA